MNEVDRQRILESQLAMTPQTWAQMRSHGVTEETPLEVELFFYAPSETQARALAGELAQRRQCETSVGTYEDTFSIQAVLPARAFSEEALLELTREMCELGARHDAEFDGWGAPIPPSIPEPKPWWKFW